MLKSKKQIFFIFFAFFACNLVCDMLQGARIKGVEAEDAGNFLGIKHNAFLGSFRFAERLEDWRTGEQHEIARLCIRFNF